MRLTPREILWHLPLADGLQYIAEWWSFMAEPKGYALRATGFDGRGKKDRLRG